MGTNKVVSLKQKAICSIKRPKASLQNVTSNVPQASILGPILFLLFINDLPEMMQEVESYGYADDFKVITRNQNDIRKQKLFRNGLRPTK